MCSFCVRILLKCTFSSVFDIEFSCPKENSNVKEKSGKHNKVEEKLQWKNYISNTYKKILCVCIIIFLCVLSFALQKIQQKVVLIFVQ